MIRRILNVLVVAALAASAACDDVAEIGDGLLHGPPPTVSVVLIDTSRSIVPEDREIYLASIGTLGEGLRGGDRLLIGPIGDQTRATFRPRLDLRIRRTDVRLDQEDAERAAKTELESSASALLATGDGADNSRILEAITAATEALRAMPDARRRMIVLSDGLENSATVNLEQDSVTPQEVARAMERAREAGLLPDLTGVELSLIGVGGSDFRGVESFWRAFADATHANLVHYGRLPYEPAP